MTWKCGGVEAALRAARKVSSVSSHQMSGFNLSQRAWGKVVIQMLLPSSTGLQLIHERKRERGTDGRSRREVLVLWEENSSAPTLTQVYILIYNEHSCPTELCLICCWGGGTGWDDCGHLRMADSIYILAVALRWLNKSQSTPCLLKPLQTATVGASPLLPSPPFPFPFHFLSLSSPRPFILCTAEQRCKAKLQ